MHYVARFPRRSRKTYRWPLNRSWPSTSCTCRDRPSKPRRMSVAPAASHTRVPDGSAITRAIRPRCAATPVHRHADRSAADSRSTTGSRSVRLASWLARYSPRLLGCGRHLSTQLLRPFQHAHRHKCRGRCCCQHAVPNLPASGEQQPRIHPVSGCNLRHPHQTRCSPRQSAASLQPTNADDARTRR